MTRKTIISMAAALVLTAGSAAYAAACGGCGDDAGCQDQQTVQKYQSETSGVRSELKSLQQELNNEYAANSINTQRTAELEQEIRGLKVQLKKTADKMGVPSCCAV